MPSHQYRHTNNDNDYNNNNTNNNNNNNNNNVKVITSTLNVEIEATTRAAPPTPPTKPPTFYHTFSGDVKSQDIFANAIREQQQQQKHQLRSQPTQSLETNPLRFRILFPGSDTFEMERYDVWNHNDICTPALILQPRNAQHVSCCIRGYNLGLKRCLQEIKKTGDNSIGLPRLVIAGGGRCSIACLKDGAIVVDLSKMNRIKVDVSNQLVTCQGGAKVVDVDRETSKFQSCVPLSTHSYSGVVGSILGGGYGYACRKYGLTCDNVCKAEVVLGDGRIQRCTFHNNASSSSASDILWSICGGGGGIAVVTSITMKCYPVCNAALLTCPLHASTLKQKRNAIRAWSEWINGHATKPTGFHGHGAAPNDVYSILILHTNHRKQKSYKCIATSIDNSIIPQSEEYLELYRDRMEEQQRLKSKQLHGVVTQSITRAADGLRISISSNNSMNNARTDSNRTNITTSSSSTVQAGTTATRTEGATTTTRSNSTNTTLTNNSNNTTNTNNSNNNTPISWEMIPGLSTLCKKAGSGSDISKMVIQKQSKFRMVRYKDLQRLLQDEKLVSPGNHFDAYKYAKALTEPIIDLLVQVTSGSKIPPNPHCQIWISSLGGVISNTPKDQVAFDARDAKFVIHIHGQWYDTANARATEKQQVAVQTWVQQIVNHLHMCQGISSTSHPESLRDQVSKSGKSKPPQGYYNFHTTNGTKLLEIKRKKDRRNVFSLASRVSFDGTVGTAGAGKTTAGSPTRSSNRSTPLASQAREQSRNHTIRQQIMEQVAEYGEEEEEEEQAAIHNTSFFPDSLLENTDNPSERVGSNRRLDGDNSRTSSSFSYDDDDDNDVHKRVSFDGTTTKKRTGSDEYEEEFGDEYIRSLQAELQQKEQQQQQDDFFPTSGLGSGGNGNGDHLIGNHDEDELKLPSPLPPPSGPIDMDVYEDDNDEDEDIREFEEWNAEQEKQEQEERNRNAI